MKKQKILLLLMACMVLACKKEDQPKVISPGVTKFFYIWQQYGNRPWVGKEPAQPFTVDSLDTVHGFGDYWVSNADGLHFTLYPDQIKAGINYKP